LLLKTPNARIPLPGLHFSRPFFSDFNTTVRTGPVPRLAPQANVRSVLAEMWKVRVDKHASRAEVIAARAKKDVACAAMMATHARMGITPVEKVRAAVAKDAAPARKMAARARMVAAILSHIVAHMRSVAAHAQVIAAGAQQQVAHIKVSTVHACTTADRAGKQAAFMSATVFTLSATAATFLARSGSTPVNAHRIRPPPMRALRALIRPRVPFLKIPSSGYCMRTRRPPPSPCMCLKEIGAHLPLMAGTRPWVKMTVLYDGTPVHSSPMRRSNFLPTSPGPAA
jgi:hypothetical protein